ncbi:protein-L-isoaspartate O-methyltransferase [Diaphorobacter ruginosibacter]|uniref:Protein-L-isoaspartate O-methyltransferase n=1 Tax=Diaphorobacter ruginosibacter TaxID=1715720 RepID=A0A7G9RUH5_9BURK|nr:protein-L-isoaspartate O-methyltransferase [Diaphorobacter ruginosibacter]QNN59250.1 protein-L-isoaspartate O-methyltransferase [Diaphorobacter ruginosibacter]
MNMPLNTSADTTNLVEQARFNMIEQQIRPWRLLDEDVLDLLTQVRREEFAPAPYRSMAFMDIEIPLNASVEEAERTGQVMLPPRVEARMLQDAKVMPTDRVLEIGTGSGYMAALLGRSAAQVLSIEINAELVDFAKDNLREAGITNVEVRMGDGSRDLSADGPFDVIILSGSVAEVPQGLLPLLTEGGRLIAVVGQEPMMRATIVTRKGSGFETTQPWDIIIPRLVNFAEPSPFKF